MRPDDKTYRLFLNILREELIPATGCTEPIAVAYCAAIARELLGGMPEGIELSVSGNILKNAKSVVVPGTGGLRGLETAVAAGVVAGRAEEKLAVIAHITAEETALLRSYCKNTPIQVTCAETTAAFEVGLKVWSGEHYARVRCVGNHTNLVYLEKDGEVLCDLPAEDSSEAGLTDKSLLTLPDILCFTKIVRLEDIAELLERLIAYNSSIAQEGLQGDYGANVGATLLRCAGDNIRVRARAWAAAGADARMSGCEMPVIILSGSGNQGMTASLPVIKYAEAMSVSRERLYRALCISALVTVFQKVKIGRLSAFCGATSAGCGAAAGIAYLHGAGDEAIDRTIMNVLAILPGMVCDGAKPSCAAKIAMAVDAGILGYEVERGGQGFQDGDGLLGKGAEGTISNVGRLAVVGMRQTDQVILDIMTGTPRQ